MRKVLVDTGPLVALLDKADADHETCIATARDLRETLVTTWPVLTEALYLLSPRPRAGHALLSEVETGHIQLAELDERDVPPIRSILGKYADLPVDLADATLVHVANRDHIDLVFTLDSDFQVYRLKGGRRFSVVP